LVYCPPVPTITLIRPPQIWGKRGVQVAKNMNGKIALFVFPPIILNIEVRRRHRQAL